MAKIFKMFQEFRETKHPLKSRVITMVSQRISEMRKHQRHVKTPTTHPGATAFRNSTSGGSSSKPCHVHCISRCSPTIPAPGRAPSMRMEHIKWVLCFPRSHRAPFQCLISSQEQRTAMCRKRSAHSAILTGMMKRTDYPPTRVC